MAIEGNLELFHLPEILQMVAAQDKTGILTVQGESDIVAISFKGGQVVGADALNQTVEEGLGQVLASQGLVSPADFARVAGEHEASGKRLLDLLLEKGLLDRGQLLDALRTQTYQLLLQLLRWDRGEFKFYSGDEVAHEEGFYAISVEELLIRSVTDLGDGEPGAQLPDLAVAYERAPNGAPVKYIGEDGSGPMDDAGAVWLGGEDRALMARLDGRTAAAEVAAETGLGDYKVLFALYRLLRAGAVRPAAEAPAVSGGPAFGAVEAARSVEMPTAEDLEPPSVERRRRAEVTPRAAVQFGRWGELSTRLVAALAAVALLSAPWRSWREVLLPLPWHEATRQAIESEQRAALYGRLDRAARTYFLLEGHYPDELTELVTRDLLPAEALRDPRGRVLAYSTDDVSYVLQPVEGGVPLAELAAREGITGDFLLDPDFLDLPAGSDRSPLVLLD